MPKRSRSGVRWGHVHELDRRIRVGSPGWEGYPRRLKHLSAWRYIHLLGKHSAVHNYGRRNKVAPSSNLHLKGKVSKLAYIKKREGR